MRALRSRRVIWAALAFVVGFSVVFVSFGATASALSRLILEYKDVLGRIAGVLIILFGLHFMGLLSINLFNREARVHLERKPAGLFGAFVIGLAFAFGWTPCIGPVLATILAVAAQSDSLAFGTSLLFVYAAGLGVPFLVAALAAGEPTTYADGSPFGLDPIPHLVVTLSALTAVGMLQLGLGHIPVLACHQRPAQAKVRRSVVGMQPDCCAVFVEGSRHLSHGEQGATQAEMALGVAGVVLERLTQLFHFNRLLLST